MECVQILNQKIHALLRKLLLKVQFINFHTNGEGGGRAGFWGEGGGSTVFSCFGERRGKHEYNTNNEVDLWMKFLL